MIELMHGDSLELMDEMILLGRKVSVVVTDPPYPVITGGENGKNGKKGQPSGILKANKQLMATIPPPREWLSRCFTLLEDESHIYVMTNLLNLKDMMEAVEEVGFYIHNLLIWEKNTVTPNKWYMKNCEYVIFAKKGKAKFINNCGSKTVHKYKNKKITKHKTEKPVGLMELYILNSSEEGQIVFDPFVGSGSSGVASVGNNRGFIGIDNGYCEKEGLVHGVESKGLAWVEVTQLRIDNEAKFCDKVDTK